jgi:hypothetical protein
MKGYQLTQVTTHGTDLLSAAVLARCGIAASTTHKMLKVLDLILLEGRDYLTLDDRVR